MKKFNANEVFFTSDTHFYHKNIINYCNRPFKSVEEMNETLIQNWNNVVKPNNTVFHLGDFSFANIKKSENIYSRLNGTIYLILGNHDYQKNICLNDLHDVYDTLFIQIDGDNECKNQRIFLSHYPMLTWDEAHRGSWQCFGHIHTMKNQKIELDSKLSPNQYDVGVDNNDFTPVSFQKLKEVITKQNLGYGRNIANK